MAIQTTMTNPYQALDRQAVEAYCVMRILRFDADRKVCEYALAAYAGPCTKEQRSAGAIQPFTPHAKHEVITGAVFDQYFDIAVLDSGTNLIRQAYRCATRSVLVPDRDPETHEPRLDAQGQPVLVEANTWAGLPEV